jgi:four helix bundle protein
MEKPHKKLDLWKVAMELVIQVYEVTDRFPKDERFSLTDQIRRAAISVPSNIAEGAARQTKKEFANYLHMAQGSLSELDTQFELARQLKYLDEHTWIGLDDLMDRIDKMISGLIRRQKSPPASRGICGF